jgi:hypothetical protein
MSRLYSARLLGGGATDSLSAVVPAGYRWVVRDAVLFFDGAGTNDDATLYVLIAGGGTGQLLYVQATASQVSLTHWEGRQVLNAGDTLGFGASTLNWYVLVSGYQLTTP